MIKTILATSIIALGMSAGAAFAQERTYKAFGIEFTTNDSASQNVFSAFSPKAPIETRPVAVENEAPRHARSRH